MGNYASCEHYWIGSCGDSGMDSGSPKLSLSFRISRKGLTHVAAQTGALCEAIETWYAEHFEGPLILSRYNDLHRRVSVAAPDLLPLARDSSFTHFEAVP